MVLSLVWDSLVRCVRNHPPGFGVLIIRPGVIIDISGKSAEHVNSLANHGHRRPFPRVGQGSFGISDAVPVAMQQLPRQECVCRGLELHHQVQILLSQLAEVQVFEAQHWQHFLRIKHVDSVVKGTRKDWFDGADQDLVRLLSLALGVLRDDGQVKVGQVVMLVVRLLREEDSSLLLLLRSGFGLRLLLPLHAIHFSLVSALAQLRLLQLNQRALCD